MGRTIIGAAVSLAGRIAHDDDDAARCSTGNGNGDVEGAFSENQEFPCRTTPASRDFMQAVYPQIGAVVIRPPPVRASGRDGSYPCQPTPVDLAEPLTVRRVAAGRPVTRNPEAEHRRRAEPAVDFDGRWAAAWSTQCCGAECAVEGD